MLARSEHVVVSKAGESDTLTMRRAMNDRLEAHTRFFCDYVFHQMYWSMTSPLANPRE